MKNFTVVFFNYYSTGCYFKMSEIIKLELGVDPNNLLGTKIPIHDGEVLIWIRDGKSSRLEHYNHTSPFAIESYTSLSKTFCELCCIGDDPDEPNKSVVLMRPRKNCVMRIQKDREFRITLIHRTDLPDRKDIWYLQCKFETDHVEYFIRNDTLAWLMLKIKICKTPNVNKVMDEELREFETTLPFDPKEQWVYEPYRTMTEYDAYMVAVGIERSPWKMVPSEEMLDGVFQIIWRHHKIIKIFNGEYTIIWGDDKLQVFGIRFPQYFLHATQQKMYKSLPKSKAI